ncbi:MAG: DNA translocase FtsK 4TM domain-containing protein, partial [Planctomycetota bacterium]|nr:DNA translocase FtsK 4TM domain-containing protein [Planctomycetota bacterium]
FGAALNTYSPADPSFNSATGAPVHNLLGAAGAHAADLALQVFGLAGGLPGGSSISILKHHDREEVLPVMVSTEIKKGEILYHRQPGGGGYGNPRDRDAKAVAIDVQNERISNGAAEQVYGVSLNEGETCSNGG